MEARIAATRESSLHKTDGFGPYKEPGAGFLEHRQATGKVRRGRDLESAWSVWIAPEIGSKPIAGLSRDDVENVRDALDSAVAERRKEGGRAGLSGARARNVWSVLPQ